MERKVSDMTWLIALGANLPSALGSPRGTLEAALVALGARGVAVTARSRWYRAPAFPPGAGPDFVNGAAAVESGLSAADLLATLHDVEKDLGRFRHRRWEPRVCDLDLIGGGDLVLPDRETAARWMALPEAERGASPPPELVLPHPRLAERAFVLVPLAEVAPDWRHPLLGLTVREIAARLPEAEVAALTPLD